MKKEINLFLNKNSFLNEKFKSIEPEEFYREIFPIGSFEKKGNLIEKKGNGIAVSIRDDKSLNFIITDDHNNVKDLIEHDFVITSAMSYYGNRRTEKNSTLLYGLTFDIDGVDFDKLETLLYQITNGVNPKPTYLVNSGHGVHLYYIFNEPIKLYNHIKEPLKELKFALTDRLWNMYTSDIKEKQFQGIFQGFRMVGSPSKFGKNYRLKAYIVGEKINLEYLNGFVPKEKQVHDLNYESKISLDQAKEKFPEWYEKVVIQKNKKPKRWDIKRDLYDWWHKKIKEEASFGHRYFCVMVLAIYAKKCNISKKELKEDAYNLIPLLTAINPKEPFREIDVKSALKSYSEKYILFPRSDIEKITAISIPKNKRNYRTQELHLKGARAIQEINDPYGEWRNTKGRPSKKQIVENYIKNNPNETPTQIAKKLGISRPTVYKYL